MVIEEEEEEGERRLYCTSVKQLVMDWYEID